MRAFIIDAFTKTPFQGNPAGVCIVDRPLSDETMRRIAEELNLSETAFIFSGDVATTFSIRYFSPKMEIPLCGHATLAAGLAVFAEHGFRHLTFVNIQGVQLSVHVSAEGISMSFPVYETSPASAPPALLAALGIEKVRNAEYNVETKILLLEIDTPGQLANLRPDFAALCRSHDTINGVLVTVAAGADGFDFHLRYFWPWSGTHEDPVTGGIQTFLTKYWSQRLGKTKMRSFQASHRPGFMDVQLKGGRVLVTGQAVIVLEGQLRLPIDDVSA